MNPTANSFIALLAICLPVGLAVASDDVNMETLKRRVLPGVRHTFTFKLCGRTMFAEITEVLPVAIGVTLTYDPKTAGIWCKVGFDRSRLDGDLGVYMVQETKSSGKVTFQTPPNPKAVNLPPQSVKAACGNNAASDEELKAIVQEVLKKANGA